MIDRELFDQQNKHVDRRLDRIDSKLDRIDDKLNSHPHPGKVSWTALLPLLIALIAAVGVFS